MSQSTGQFGATSLKSSPLKSPRISPAFFAWLLVAPALLFILVIVAWPLLETFRLSFTNARLGGESYVGLENYEKLWLQTDDSNVLYQVCYLQFSFLIPPHFVF